MGEGQRIVMPNTRTARMVCRPFPSGGSISSIVPYLWGSVVDLTVVKGSSMRQHVDSWGRLESGESVD